MSDAPLRAVLDANILVSALIAPAGPPGRIIDRFLSDPPTDRSFTLLLSPATVAEATRCLAYPKVRRYIKRPGRAIEMWLTDLTRLADFVTELAEVDPVAADPDDTIYLATAVAGRATHMVTGDRHLLDLARYRNTQIVSPATYWQLLRERKR